MIKGDGVDEGRFFFVGVVERIKLFGDSFVG